MSALLTEPAYARRRIPGIGRARWAKAHVAEWRQRRRLAGPKLLKAFARSHPDAFFVEIGANDGDQHDHLRPFIIEHRWRGAMVEPVPYIFARLRDNYAGLTSVTLVNAAIADRDGTLPFFHLRDASRDERAQLPDWYDGIGSFSRDNVLAHAEHIADVESRLVRSDVQAMTLDSLCRRLAAPPIDLLVIDTEGYDGEILRTIDFDRHRPRLLVYEHFHLEPAERRQCLELVAAAGYSTLEEGFDTFCTLPGPGDALDRARAGAQPGMPALSAHDEN